MESKKWYQSKIVWMGVLQTLIGMLGLLAEFLKESEFSPMSVVVLVSGFLTVILRIWFTETVISK